MYKYGLLLVAGLALGAGAAFAQNADTVDGFHAYGTPHANALLALNGSARMSGAVIANNSIPGSRLVPGAVTAGRLGNNSVTTEKISDGQVMSADLAAGAVTRTKIANGAVTTTRIADQAVTGGKLAYGAVTAGRLGDNSVSTSKIIDGAIRGEDVHIPLLVGGSRNGYLIGCFNGSSGSSTSGITGYSTASSGSTRGVVGACNSPDGIGVFGVAKHTSGDNYGVYGVTNSWSGYGVYGENHYNDCYGYIGGYSQAVYGRDDSGNNGELGSGNFGASGYHAATNNRGHLGTNGSGVAGDAYGTDDAGVRGTAFEGSGAKGVYGYSTSGDAGYFQGDCYVSDDFDVGGSKNFKIDHPLDPENMYLYHSCVESSERKNVYDGTVILDARGEAWICVPDWFEALNRDFRYQLTPVGAPAPNLFVAQKIVNGYFKIAGGLPELEISWQVTGTRQDPYALAHPFEVEVEKPERERGSYLHPELYGMPETTSVEWATSPDLMMEIHSER